MGARQLPSDLAAIYGVSRNSYRSLVPCQWWPPIFHNSTPHNPRLYRWIRGARMRNIETRPTIYCRLRVKQGTRSLPSIVLYRIQCYFVDVVYLKLSIFNSKVFYVMLNLEHNLNSNPFLISQSYFYFSPEIEFSQSFPSTTARISRK